MQINIINVKTFKTFNFNNQQRIAIYYLKISTNNQDQEKFFYAKLNQNLNDEYFLTFDKDFEFDQNTKDKIFDFCLNNYIQFLITN